MATRKVTVNPDQLRIGAKIALYRQDFARFAQEQLWIKPKVTAAEPVGTPVRRFTLNPPQRVINAVAEKQLKDRGYIRLCALKARQPGISTWTEARVFHSAALHPNVASLVLAQDDKTSAHIFGLAKLFYDHLDGDIKPMYRYSTKTELTFENPDEKTRGRWPGLRSKMHFQTAKNVHAGTGQTLTSLHWSEAAKVVDAQTIATSVFQSIQMAAGTLIVVESTAYPTGDWFRDLCERAKSGKDVWQFVFLPWFLSPEYVVPLDPGERLKYDANERHLLKRVKVEWHVDLTPEQMKFRRWKIQEGGGDAIAEELFKQEYPSDDTEAWISTDLAVFDHRKLYEIRPRLCAPEWTGDIDSGPRLLTNPNGQLWIWKHPEKGHMYDIGADVATGTEDGDYSVAEVIDRTTREQVAEWRGHISTLDYAPILYWLGKYYNTAQVAVEVTGVGVSTNEKLNQMGYPYIYIWRYRGKAVPQLSTFSGWETGHKSKKVMIGLMRHLFLGDKFLIHSGVLHNEMKSFAVISLESGDETYRGSMGMHDDCVMAMAIALQISDDESWGVMQELRGDVHVPHVRLSDPKWVQSIDPAFNEHLDPVDKGSGLDQMTRALRGWK